MFLGDIWGLAHDSDTMQILLSNNVPDERQLAVFRTDIQQMLLLHKCVNQKVAVDTFLACNRLDRDFVQLAQPSNKKVDERYKFRLTLLSIFLAGIPCEPKYRVRYIRYTIKVNMALENYGVAASYIKLLLKYAKSNTSKLEKELEQCQEHNDQNYCAPDCMIQPGAPFYELFQNVRSLALLLWLHPSSYCCIPVV
eukprot:COSAG05_NODE_1569_length_4530_cov_2.165877_3_plen_196_part_00